MSEGDGPRQKRRRFLVLRVATWPIDVITDPVNCCPDPKIYGLFAGGRWDQPSDPRVQRVRIEPNVEINRCEHNGSKHAFRQEK